MMEKYKQLVAGVRDIEDRRSTLAAQHQKANILWNKALDAYQAAVFASEAPEAIANLSEEAARLKVTVDSLADQIRILTPRNAGDVQTMIAGSLSPLNKLATEVVEEASKQMEQCSQRLEKLIDEDLVKKKESYLLTVAEIAEEFKELYDITRIGMDAQRYIPKHLRTIKKPRIKSIPGNFLEIGLADIQKVYGTRQIL